MRRQLRPHRRLEKLRAERVGLAKVSPAVWERTRAEALAREPRCLLCGQAAEDAHPLDRSVQTMGGERPDGVVCLCGQCRAWAESEGAGPPHRVLPTGIFKLAKRVGKYARIIRYFAATAEQFQLREAELVERYLGRADDGTAADRTGEGEAGGDAAAEQGA
jgi:hypothetical protein